MQTPSGSGIQETQAHVPAPPPASCENPLPPPPALISFSGLCFLIVDQVSTAYSKGQRSGMEGREHRAWPSRDLQPLSRPSWCLSSSPARWQPPQSARLVCSAPPSPVPSSFSLHIPALATRSRSQVPLASSGPLPLLSAFRSGKSSLTTLWDWVSDSSLFLQATGKVACLSLLHRQVPHDIPRALRTEGQPTLLNRGRWQADAATGPSPPSLACAPAPTLTSTSASGGLWAAGERHGC